MRGLCFEVVLKISLASFVWVYDFHMIMLTLSSHISLIHFNLLGPLTVGRSNIIFGGVIKLFVTISFSVYAQNYG